MPIKKSKLLQLVTSALKFEYQNMGPVEVKLLKAFDKEFQPKSIDVYVGTMSDPDILEEFNLPFKVGFDVVVEVLTAEHKITRLDLDGFFKKNGFKLVDMRNDTQYLHKPGTNFIIETARSSVYPKSFDLMFLYESPQSDRVSVEDYIPANWSAVLEDHLLEKGVSKQNVDKIVKTFNSDLKSVLKDHILELD